MVICFILIQSATTFLCYSTKNPNVNEKNIHHSIKKGVSKNMVNWGGFNTEIRKDKFFSNELKVFQIL